MLLEQITTDYEDDDNQQPAPKGMVRTEMGRLVKKADQDAWEKKSTAAMQAQLKSRGASSLKEKKVGAALKTMKNKKILTPETGRDTSLKHAYNTTEDSSGYYLDVMQKESGNLGKGFFKAKANLERQSKKGADGYDKNGNPEVTPFFKKGEETAKYGYKNK